MIVAMFLLLVFLRVFFYHNSSGAVKDVWWDGRYPYIRLSDGHVYQASACKDEPDHQGNIIRFIALGPDLSFLGKRTAVPVIIYCKFPGGWLDDGELHV